MNREEGLATGVRSRDEAALAAAVAHASSAGLLDRLRDLPPATVDRVAAAGGWPLGATRAALQALAAAGLVHHDPELATWSLRADADELAGSVARTPPELARALACGTAAPDVPPIEALEGVLAREPALRAALERGAKVAGLAGSDAALRWLAARYPGLRTLRLDETQAVLAADLVLHLSPLALPEDPVRWFTCVVRGLAGEGRIVMRALRAPLEPPEPAARAGRGWWHAVALADALQGGGGRAWSEPLVRRAALAAGCASPTPHEWPADPACVHLVVRHGGDPGSARPR